MTRRSRFLPILALSLALLPAGLVACNKDKAGEASETPAAEGTPAASAAPGAGDAAPAPGQPGAAPVAPSKPVDPAQMPDVVAKVNGKEIKKDELLTAARVMQQQIVQASRGQQVPPLDERFYKQVLDSLVAQILLTEDAKAQGVTVSDEELKPQMAALRGRFPNEADYKKALEKEGLTDKKLQEKLRQEAVIQKYLGTKVLNNVAVTDQAAREFYDKNQDKMQRPERAHLRHILIGVKPGASEEEKKQAREKAEGVLEKLKDGEDFAKLAAENSDDPGSKARGGDLSWVVRGQGAPPAFEKAAFALARPNDLSGVVETPYGFHILQLVEREAAGAVPFEEARPRITQMLQQKQAGERLQAHVEGLKKKGKVEIFL